MVQSPLAEVSPTPESPQTSAPVWSLPCGSDWHFTDRSLSPSIQSATFDRNPLSSPTPTSQAGLRLVHISTSAWGQLASFTAQYRTSPKRCPAQPQKKLTTVAEVWMQTQRHLLEKELMAVPSQCQRSRNWWRSLHSATGPGSKHVYFYCLFLLYSRIKKIAGNIYPHRFLTGICPTAHNFQSCLPQRQNAFSPSQIHSESFLWHPKFQVQFFMWHHKSMAILFTPHTRMEGIITPCCFVYPATLSMPWRLSVSSRHLHPRTSASWDPWDLRWGPGQGLQLASCTMRSREKNT